MKKIKENISKVVFVTALPVLLGTTMVFAGTSYSGYNTTVGRLNGNGYTGYQTKATSGANGNLSSSSVGGGYLVDVRMQESNGTAGAWTRNVKSQSERDLDGNVNHKKGDKIRLQFSNDFDTPVAVQVSGSWRSN
ncbi:hypothetical protein [uncultured Anaerococcus sp.]|uniref:hypothetical protein n=1 Tax=uncultured Anaerococcus sp. TaxID=293428 RepID=UPI0026056C39|nr:hypothetical protein [uncultured Anaerococcus sp.]